MANKSKTAVKGKAAKKQPAPSKKVTFSKKNEVTTFDKNAVVGKRKLADQEDKKEHKKAKAVKTVKAVKVVEQLSDDEVANDEELEALDEEQEEALRKEILGDLVESDDDEDDQEDDDSSDDDDHIETNENVVSLDKKKPAKTQQKTPAKADDESDETGIVYVGRIPEAFVEADMIKYFQQFGDILKIRISKNKKGQSRHYGFVQFASKEVAEIVADTMNNYLIDGRLLQVQVIPTTQHHDKMFDQQKKTSELGFLKRTANKRNKDQDVKQYLKRAEKLVQTENKKRNALKSKGIDYDFPGYAASLTQWKPKFTAKIESA
ncbi:hypothetical protein BC940DRAFT_297543 [Gongronella butleri]|nr:hypothetical protein BC940DRAFT_297543 [Gongronella butleri]